MLAKVQTKDELRVFAGRLYQRRTELNLSQEALGLLIGMKEPESAKVKISRYESGTNDVPLTSLKALAEALNISADWLIGLSSEPRGLVNESDLSSDDFGALQEFRAGQIESLVDRWKKRLRK